MAAQSYYKSYPDDTANPYHDYPHARQHQAVSPITSPIDGERPHAFAKPSFHTTYSGSSSRVQEETDPYEDDNAIPLNGRKSRGASTQTITPILHADDAYVQDAGTRSQKGGSRQDGWFKGKITWVVYALSIVQLIVFIAQIARNATLTGSPIEIHPSFNPMIGPSPYVLINMGARYPPCMHYVASIQNSTTKISWPCPNATETTGASVSCTLSDLCGFGGFPDAQAGNPNGATPNQWWRFIVPIFLHAGIIHIGFNLLLQMTLGRDVERLIGSIRFTIVYFASGIFGFVLGGNFAAAGIASTGCSGSLFGILAISFIDICYTWKERPSPIRDVIFVLLDVAIAFVLGLLPGLDNFSHIGGFLMGLVLGICILRSPRSISRRTIPEVTYTHAPDKQTPAIGAFAKDPRGFFLHRRGIWWVWWLVRVAALIGVLIAFILLLKNFYVWMNTCSWCKYLSCLDITVGGTKWCDIGNLNFTPTNSTTPARRNVLAFGGAIPSEIEGFLAFM